MLWIIHWSSHGTVQTYVDGFLSYILRKLVKSDVYFLFDRYYSYRIKDGTRSAQAGDQASRVHKLTPDTPLSPQKVVLTVTKNEVQLISIICQQLIRKVMLVYTDDQLQNNDVITGSDAIQLK